MRPRKQSGFFYVEVLVASLLIAISLIPTLEALQSGIQGSGIHQSLAIDHYQLATKMEVLLAEPFGNLADAAGNPTTPIDYITSDEETLPNVYLSRYDGDNADGDGNGFTGPDDDLLWIKVESESTGQSLESLSRAY